jgi:predicted aspartyl protease
MKVWVEGEIIGERKIKVPMLVNSLSDLVVLPTKIAKRVRPKFLGYEILIKVGGGGKVKGKACLVKVKIKDKKGEEREVEVEGVVIKGEENCILGHEALSKLRTKVDFSKGELEFV